MDIYVEPLSVDKLGKRLCDIFAREVGGELQKQLATARNDALEEALTVIREELERARKYLPQAAIIVAAVEKDILALKTKEPTP